VASFGGFTGVFVENNPPFEKWTRCGNDDRSPVCFSPRRRERAAFFQA
jgi:hypothetical protein